jgi:hypothetical protein
MSQRLLQLAASVLLVAAGFAHQVQTQVQTIDIITLGPQVGQRAIEFRLADQHGRAQTLASVAGSKGTMLVFFRSADW